MPIINKRKNSPTHISILWARLMSVENAETQCDLSDFRRLLKFGFVKLTENEYDSSLEFCLFTGRTITAENRLGSLLKALGISVEEIKDEENFDTDLLLGRSCYFLLDAKRDSPDEAMEFLSVLSTDRATCSNLV